MSTVYLVFIAAAASLLATLAYVRSMFRGGAKPNRVSWLMWSIAPLIATAAAVNSGVGWAVLPVFMSGFGPLLVFIASFFTKASWKLSSFDYACGLLSGLALVLWQVTANPNIAIILAIASDGLATVPTIVKGWSHPETESPWPFIVGFFAPMTSFAVARIWSLSAVGFSAYLTVVNFMMIISIYHKKLISRIKR